MFNLFTAGETFFRCWIMIVERFFAIHGLNSLILVVGVFYKRREIFLHFAIRIEIYKRFSNDPEMALELGLIIFKKNSSVFAHKFLNVVSKVMTFENSTSVETDRVESLTILMKF